MIQPSPSLNYMQHPPVYLQRDIGISKRLVIIGEATDGELYHPIFVSGIEMARDMFQDGPLIEAYQDANAYSGELDAFLMRIEPFQEELAFSVLEAFSFDLLYIHERYYNEDPESFHSFIKFAKTKEEKGSLIHGIVSLSPELSYQELLTIGQQIEDFTIHRGDDAIEEGKYLSIVVDHSSTHNSGAVYAGILASLNPEVSPINKTIPDFKLELEFQKNEILKLREMGLVCFRTTFKNGVTCTSSSCAVSTAGSVHKHIANFRIAQSLINQVSQELQPFIGRPHVRSQTYNIETIIDAICQEFIYLNRIRTYQFDLTVNEVYGYVEIEIEIVPIFSIHAITTHSRVRVFS